MQAGTIFVMTHDSIGLGEDGPTHQPIEHLASFRAMPNILMMRPGDGNETAGCYKVSKAPLAVAWCIFQRGVMFMHSELLTGNSHASYAKFI